MTYWRLVTGTVFTPSFSHPLSSHGSFFAHPLSSHGSFLVVCQHFLDLLSWLQKNTFFKGCLSKDFLQAKIMQHCCKYLLWMTAKDIHIERRMFVEVGTRDSCHLCLQKWAHATAAVYVCRSGHTRQLPFMFAEKGTRDSCRLCLQKWAHATAAVYVCRGRHTWQLPFMFA